MNICKQTRIYIFSVITISRRTQDRKFYCISKCKEGTEWKMVSEIENEKDNIRSYCNVSKTQYMISQH